MADSAQAPVQEHWSETNGKKYRRGSRLPKKTDADFEDMMSKFKARSDEKISDLKKSFISKRGGPTKPRR